jgi:hypothetical protein
VALGVRGVLNVLKHLGMVAGEPVLPAYQTAVERSLWVRAQWGGLLRFHVAPGAIVDEGDEIATCEGFFRADSPCVRAPVGGIVLGMTTLPVVRPGEPICHIGIPTRPLAEIRDELSRSLRRRVKSLGGGAHVVGSHAARRARKRS